MLVTCNVHKSIDQSGNLPGRNRKRIDRHTWIRSSRSASFSRNPISIALFPQYHIATRLGLSSTRTVWRSPFGGRPFCTPILERNQNEMWLSAMWIGSWQMKILTQHDDVLWLNVEVLAETLHPFGTEHIWLVGCCVLFEPAQAFSIAERLLRFYRPSHTAKDTRATNICFLFRFNVDRYLKVAQVFSHVYFVLSHCITEGDHINWTALFDAIEKLTRFHPYSKCNTSQYQFCSSYFMNTQQFSSHETQMKKKLNFTCYCYCSNQ